MAPKTNVNSKGFRKQSHVGKPIPPKIKYSGKHLVFPVWKTQNDSILLKGTKRIFFVIACRQSNTHRQILSVDLRRWLKKKEKRNIPQEWRGKPSICPPVAADYVSQAEGDEEELSSVHRLKPGKKIKHLGLSVAEEKEWLVWQ